MNTIHTINGRAFRAIGESTLEHDLTTWRIIHEAGLDQPAIREDESPEAFSHRLLSDLIASGKACELLGCLLIPEDTRSEDWTPASGHETAVFLSRLTRPDDKRRAQNLVVSALIEFFEQGLVSSKTSAIFSQRGPGEPASHLTGTDNGERSSASSPDTTTTAPGESSDGPCARP